MKESALLSDSRLEGMVANRKADFFQLQVLGLLTLSGCGWDLSPPGSSRFPPFQPEAADHPNLSEDEGPQHRNENSKPSLPRGHICK